jgi:hypothetical protein
LRIEYSDVSVTLFEDILDIILFGITFEFLFGPKISIRTQVMIVVKAIDKLLSVNVLLIRRTAVPQMGVSVDDKYLFLQLM